MQYLVGIDAGTQSLRSCVFDQRGEMLGMAEHKYDTSFPATGWVEQEPSEWVYGLETTLKRAIRQAGLRGEDISAIACTCTSCTVVAVDELGRPLRPSLLWMDERAWREAEVVTATADSVLKYTGRKESPQWGLPKAMWLAKNEPEIYNRAQLIVEQTDFLTHEMTQRWTASRNNATAKWHYLASGGGWPTRLLSKLGMDHLLAKLPKDVLPVGTPVGQISPDFAARTGLSTNTLVAEGGVDSHAAMIGVGAVTPGDMALIVGTSTCLMGQSLQPVFADVWGPYHEAVEDGTYTLGGGQSSTGSIMQWLLNDIARGTVSYKEMDRLAADVPPGCEGLVALDFFQGNRTPFKDPLARGAIWGLTLRHGLAHVYRAFYEAAAYGTRAIIDNLDRHEHHVLRLLAAGGGSKSMLWMQIHADVNQRPVQLAGNDEPAALGAAVWAGMGAGLFQGHRDGVDNMVRPGETIWPDEGQERVYDFYYSKYVETYERLKSCMHDVVRFENDMRTGG